MGEVFAELLAKSETKTHSAETIRQHTDELLKRHELFKQLYPNALTEQEWEILKDASEYHDVGKANTKFQNKVHTKEQQLQDDFEVLEEIPHAYLSCAYMPKEKFKDKYSQEELKILMQAVYYHHERVKEKVDHSKQIINADLEKYIPLLQEQQFEVREILKQDYGRLVKKPKELADLYPFIKIKGFLNKIDYTASAHVEVEIPHNDLLHHLDKYYRLKDYSKNDLQNYLSEHPDENHVVIASTGIGKTEGALYWIGNDKGIFTLPLKVSINAIYDRMIEDYQYGKEYVGLLHSDSYLEYLKRNEDHEFSLSALNHTKKFAMPLTITTLDQVIDFVGLYPGFEMKLAIFSYSKLVIDEIQMYSPRLVAFIIMGLKYITDMGGKFLIMTATLPPLFIDEMHRQGIPFIQPKEPFLKLNKHGDVISRHVMAIYERDLTVDEVIANSIDRKVLIIVNTVCKAQALYKAFNDEGIATQLLHSRFIKKDRQEKEAAIKKLGKKECHEKGIWITTQLVEASIDIDFDVLYTELSEATGLFQRMGRVFRGRDYKETQPNVYVYTGEQLPSGISTSDKSVVDYSIYQKSKEVLLQYHEQSISEKLKMDIIEQIYSRDALGEDCQYIKEFEDTIKQLKNVLPYEEKEKPTLRDIKNVSVIPHVIYKHNEANFIKMRDTLADRKLGFKEKLDIQNEIQQFIVDIPYWAYEKAKKNHLIADEINVNRFTNYPIVSFKYSIDEGLIYDIDVDSVFM